MKYDAINGLVAAAMTGFDADMAVDLEVIADEAEFLYNNGIRTAFLCGTTGESLSLTLKERKAVVSRWLEAKPKDFKIIVHVGCNSIEDSKELASHAQAKGADAISAMAPSFFKPDSIEDLVKFCQITAASAPELPFYYYHIPSQTGVALPMVDFLSFANDRIPNLAGIKFTHENLMEYELCREVCDSKYDILFGRDEILLCGLTLGAKGAVGSTYNIAAPLYHRIIEAFENRDLDEARRLQTHSMHLVQLLCSTSGSFMAALKAVFKILGIDCGFVRSPLRNIDSSEYAYLEKELKESGLIEYCSR